MTRYILILIFLGTFWACDDDIQEPATAKFEMNFTAATSTATPTELANLIKHMRIFLFDKLDGTLKHEVKNLVRTATSVSSGYFPVGTWHMIAVSNLEDEKADFAPEESRDIKKLLYEFKPSTSASDNIVVGYCPQIVTFENVDLTVVKDKDAAYAVNFTRAVAKVIISIISVKHKSIDTESSEHTVYIEEVPTSLNFMGALLDENGFSNRSIPSVLSTSTHTMSQSIVIGEDNKIEFIIPAYKIGLLDDFGKENDSDNRKLLIGVRLKKKASIGVGFYINQDEIIYPPIANRILNVLITISERGIDIHTEVSAWKSGIIELPGYN